MKNLNYSDIYLVPNYSEIESRDNINTEVEFLGQKFKCPILPANMASTIDFKKAEELSEAGYFYILHRFYPYDDIVDWLVDERDLKTTSISVGVKDKDKEFLERIPRFIPDYITIDVAHGHCKLVKEMIAFIKQLGFSSQIIAGNVMTADAVLDLKSWGADAVKVGLSQGAGCSTYNTTAIGGPMFSSILECSKYEIPIIADGGIREKGDYCRALVGGASMIMSGIRFAELKDSPAPLINHHKKSYYGSASAKNKGHNSYIEGKELEILIKNQTYLEYFDEIEQAIRSCMSYGNCQTVSEMKNKIKYEILH